MKTKIFPALIGILVLGVIFGVIGSQFVIKMTAYANASATVAQGRSIMQKYAAYRNTNGTAPDQKWFSSLGDLTTTCEGFQWIYLNPPLVLDDEREVAILTATNDNNRYLCGFSDLSILYTDLHQTKKANKAEMATPRKPSD
jgi:type II secretory pathway pseudopilin PulG